MASVSHQLLQGTRIGSGWVVALFTLSAAMNSALAGTGDPSFVHEDSGDVVAGTTRHEFYPQQDLSCEPSFRGGNCHDGCLTLWQGYCAERPCAHSHTRRHLGFGCFPIGFFSLGHTSTCSSGACGHGCPKSISEPLASPTVPDDPELTSNGDDFSTQPVGQPPAQPRRVDPLQPQVPPFPVIRQDLQEDGGQPALDLQDGSWSDEPAEATPPVNPLPPNAVPLPPEPDASPYGTSEAAGPATPPSPPRIDFSVEPTQPRRARFNTVSAQPNSGTTRLLRQLRED